MRVRAALLTVGLVGVVVWGSSYTLPALLAAAPKPVLKPVAPVPKIPAPAPKTAAPSAQAVAGPSRGYGGRPFLELSGVGAGWLKNTEGGTAIAAVIKERASPGGVVKKHIGPPMYEDIAIECGTGMSKAFYQAITDFFAAKVQRMDGAIVMLDGQSEISRLTFSKALISEVGFPALDAARKDACGLSLKLSPEFTRRAAGQAGAAAKAFALTQKKWMPANFRLSIAGLDCTRVSKIEPIVGKFKVATDSVGAARDYAKEPAGLELSNLVVTLAESQAKSFYDWHESFVVKGKNTDGDEKDGTLEFLTPNLQEVLFTLQLKHLGVIRVAPDKSAPGNEAVHNVRAEMYIEQIAFSAVAAWAGAAPDTEDGPRLAAAKTALPAK